MNPEAIPAVDLAAQFGAVTDADSGEVEREICGDLPRRIVAEATRLVIAQHDRPDGRAILRGFFLSGPPGSGKTTLVRRIAYGLGVCLAPRGVRVQFVRVDGGHVARSRYGESEEQIRSIITGGHHARDDAFVVLLLDDVESILMARSADQAREWHFSQNSVFFHAVDELDPRRRVLFLTSNRPDLVDDAIIDRFIRYELPAPDAPLLAEVVRRLGTEYGLSDAATERLARTIGAPDGPPASSFRDAERAVFRETVAAVIGSDPIGRL